MRKYVSLINKNYAVADLGGAPPSYGPKFSQFHTVFHKIWQNHMLAPPLEGWRPLLRGILDPPLEMSPKSSLSFRPKQENSSCKSLNAENIITLK